MDNKFIPIFNVNENRLGGLSNTPLVSTLPITKTVCIDYFKVRFNRLISINSKTFKELLTLLGVKPDLVTYENCQHWDGYDKCFTLGSDIKYMYGGKNTSTDLSETTILELKGSACRNFDERNEILGIDFYDAWIKLILFCIENDAIAKRIDLPLDYYDTELTFEKLLDKIYKKSYVSGFRTNPVIIKSNGTSITFGKFSNRTLCIYDKLQERAFHDYEVNKESWIRFEARFKNENCEDLLTKLLKALNDKDLGSLVCSLIKGLLDIKVKTTDNNLSRAESWDLWDKLLNNKEKIGITSSKHSIITLKKKFDWYKRSVTKVMMMLEIAYPDISKELFGSCGFNNIQKLKPKDVAIINDDLIRNNKDELTYEEAISRAKKLYESYSNLSFDSRRFLGIEDKEDKDLLLKDAIEKGKDDIERYINENIKLFTISSINDQLINKSIINKDYFTLMNNLDTGTKTQIINLLKEKGYLKE